MNRLVCFRGKDSLDINNAGEKWGSHHCTYSVQYVHTEYMHQFTNENEIRKYLREKEKNKLNPSAESKLILRSHCVFFLIWLPLPPQWTD
jgi:hypothetical protein